MMDKIISLCKSRHGKIVPNDEGSLCEGITRAGKRMILYAFTSSAAKAANALVTQGEFKGGKGEKLLETKETSVYTRGKGIHTLNLLHVAGVPAFEVGPIYGVTEAFEEKVATAINKAKSVQRLRSIRTHLCNVLGITVAQLHAAKKDDLPFSESSGMREIITRIDTKMVNQYKKIK